MSDTTWLCAGQSNMGMRVCQSDDASGASDLAADADVRIYRGDQWEAVTPDGVEAMPAVPFFFAAELSLLLARTVRIAVAAKGGTGIEAWLPRAAFPDTARGRHLAGLADDPAVRDAAVLDAADFRPYGQHRLARWGLGRAVPGQLFHDLLVPLAHIPVDGVLWYQGESNADTMAQAAEYGPWLCALIRTYRSRWRCPDLPFVIIQLPEYRDAATDGGQAWERLRQSQAEVARTTRSTALVDTHGLGDSDDIHPKRKREVGKRAAVAAATFAWKTHAQSEGTTT